jgi:site-specific DNA-methyltransferase (cytosine-N4-specific)
VDQFINRLVEIFAEVKRVLRDNGVLWLNIGDAYTSGDRGYRAPDKKHPVRAMTYWPNTPEGLRPKDLVGLPWRLAFALQRDGWYLRVGAPSGVSCRNMDPQSTPCTTWQ